GDALAILAGDWLVAHAFELLAECETRARIPNLVHALARGTQSMVVGQGADIEGEQASTDGERVRFIHRHKTAALLEACATMGAHAARAWARGVAGWARLGGHLGLAFKFCDAFLDVPAPTAALGNRAGKDGGASKQPSPAAFGVDECRRQARSEIDAA